MTKEGRSISNTLRQGMMLDITRALLSRKTYCICCDELALKAIRSGSAREGHTRFIWLDSRKRHDHVTAVRKLTVLMLQPAMPKGC